MVGLTGLWEVTGWEIPATLTCVGTLQAPPLFPLQPHLLTPPACVVVHTWSTTHSLDIACRLLSMPSIQPTALAVMAASLL